MKKFLLLRNNKQSGPYSTEELQQMGLKPYDLIWVEGKSAAWRYPGEVEELKSFAPAVEEQPYDRFYKKHTETENKDQSSAPIQTSSVTQPAAQQQPVEKPARKKEYKRVFVTLPSNGTTQPLQKTATEPAKATQFQPPAAEPIKTTQYQPPVPGLNEALPAEELYEKKVYSQPKTAKETKAEIYFPKKRRFSGVPLAAMIIGMLVMAAIGIVIGMSLNGNQPFSLIKKTEQVNPVDNKEQLIVPTDPRKSGNGSTDQAAAQVILDTAADKDMQKQHVKTPPAVKKNSAAVDTNLQNVTASIPAKEEVQINKDEAPLKKDPPKPSMPDLEKLVSVSNNDFEVGPFGGISKLALTVKNSSDYDLSLVVVQLEYIKANNEVFKTENLYFRDVAANSTVTVDAPKSGRGNKINYKVTLINSKDHIFHAGN
jgi:hypothetical protein